MQNTSIQNKTVHVRTVYSIQYTVQYTVYSIQYTVYSIQYTVYSIQCTVYSIQYILCSVRNNLNILERVHVQYYSQYCTGGR